MADALTATDRRGIPRNARRMLMATEMRREGIA